MRELRLPFPLAGMDRRIAFKESDPQSTFYAENVFPDSSDGRARGGTRPGLTKRFSNQLLGTPQFMLALVTVEGDPYKTLVVGTTTDAYQSQSVKSGSPGSVTYTESLVALSGVLEVSDGVPLQTEDNQPLVVSEFDFGEIPRGTVTTYQGTLIIASSGDVVSEGTGTVTNGRLTSPNVSDWNSLNIDLQKHTVQLFGDINGTYEIQNVETTNIVVSNLSSSGEVTYKILDGPKILDFENEIFRQMIPTSGFVPAGAAAVAVYRDRMVWGVGRGWFMSRIGDIFDYDYGADSQDLSRAVAATNSDAGQPGDPIVAMAPAGYDYLLMFGEDSTWVLRGDPVYQGQLYPLSRTVGCVDTSAWCRGQGEEVYFLSKNGLYRINSSVDSAPVPLTQETLPLEMLVADRDNYDTTLAYDSQDEAIVIFITPKGSGAGQHWWFDLSTQSFWRMSFISDHEPVSALGFTGNPTQTRKMLVLCSDGYVREFTPGNDDDGTAITSQVVLGPYRMTESYCMDGLLNELQVATDTGSDAVSVEVYVGDTAEEATEAAQAGTSPFYSLSVPGGQSRTMRPRARGSAFCVRIDSTGSWSFEAAAAKVLDDQFVRIQ